MRQRTNAEYIEASHQCPYCGSDEINGYGSLDMQGDRIYQDIHCMSCKKTWTDEYALTGYTEAEA